MVQVCLKYVVIDWLRVSFNVRLVSFFLGVDVGVVVVVMQSRIIVIVVVVECGCYVVVWDVIIYVVVVVSIMRF